MLSHLNPRTRFIGLVTALYIGLGLAWIFLSDRLLRDLVAPEAVLGLSLAKGVVFVLASGAALLLALRAVPPRLPATQFASALGRQRTLPAYGLALALVLAVWWLRAELERGGAGHFLILFTLPIALAALLGGLGPGLAATALSALLACVRGPPGAFFFAVPAGPQVISWLFLLFNGLTVSILGGSLRRSLARAEAARQLLDSVVSGTSDAVFVKDREGRYRMINAAAASVAGAGADDVLGKDDFALMPPADAAAVRKRDAAILAGGNVVSYEESLTGHDGMLRYFHVTKGPVYDAAGRIDGLFGIARDVTGRLRGEAELRARERQLARVLEGSELGYWDWNLQTGSIAVSERFESMLGYGPGEMRVGAGDWQFIHPDDRGTVMAALERRLSGEEGAGEIEMRCRARDGSWRWILARGKVVERDSLGRPRIYAGTHTDVTARKELELAQREAATVFENSFDGIMVISLAQRITKINPAFTRITGYRSDEVIGDPPSLLSPGRHGAQFCDAIWDSIRKRHFWRGEVWDRRRNGEMYPALLSLSAVRDAAGRIEHVVGVFSDIGQIKAHEAELDRIAHYDPLTGAPNRRLLSDRLDRAIKSCNRSGATMAVCFLDLDGFKEINDRHGHAAGDALLIGVAGNLRQALREEDTLARLGGDEFVVLLLHLGSRGECDLVLERIQRAAAMPVQTGELVLQVSASIGVTLYPEDRADADTLLRHADYAMYLAKEAGKNCTKIFDPEGDRKAQQARRDLAEVADALSRGQFVLHYQPKVDLRDGALISVEGLLRWEHPERGLLGPDEFLPYVSGSALETALGDWVIGAGLAQAARWRSEGLVPALSVNVSAEHLLQPGFCARLQAALAHHALPADQNGCAFELEVLETVALADMPRAIKVLQRCRALGVAFALDDFGTGYSSLTYLRQLPVDVLKIDRSFVKDMLDDSEDAGIVEGVIRLAGAFHRGVIAEGVETLAHGAALLALGCPVVQGYGVAPPMPAASVKQWLDEWRSARPWEELALP